MDRRKRWVKYESEYWYIGSIVAMSMTQKKSRETCPAQGIKCVFDVQISAQKCMEYKDIKHEGFEELRLRALGTASIPKLLILPQWKSNMCGQHRSPQHITPTASR